MSISSAFAGPPIQTRDGALPVAIVVTCYNQSHWLGDALDSALRQEPRAQEIVVVDDGSDDDVAAVVARYPQVALVRQRHSGVSAARNRGLADTASQLVVFLDADDILYPGALASGVRAMQANPGAGMVYGAFRYLDAELGAPSAPRLRRTGPQALRVLLRENAVRMNGAAMFSRKSVDTVGGFDEGLPMAEDYDLYLRLADRGPIASHLSVVAGYRRHGTGLSSDRKAMLEWTRAVHARHEPDPSNAILHAAWRDGEERWLSAFSELAWSEDGATPGGDAWSERKRLMRMAPRLSAPAALRALAIRVLPRRVADWLRHINRRPVDPPVGQVDMGDLARIAPISDDFGYARGNPVDRYYIERFIERERPAIRGRVLELADALYASPDDPAVATLDVLSIAKGDGVTLVGDLTDPDTLACRRYDCAIVTQALQLVYDMPAAVRNLYAALAPGGVLLASVPGISPVRPDPTHGWFWSLTGSAAERLFGDVFGPDNVKVEVFGNAFAATAALQGIAQEDIGPGWLDPVDQAYPVVIAIKAVKPA